MKKPYSLFIGKLAAVLTASALLITTVGCGGDKASLNEQSGSTAPAAETKTEEKAKPVTLKMITWSNQATIEAIKELNAKVAEKYPNITVEVQDVDTNQYPQLKQTRIAASDVDIVSNNAFDMGSIEWAKGMDKPAWEQEIEAGTYLDLTGQAFLNNWDPNMIKDACSYNGKPYGMSMGKVAFNGIFYNKTIFEQNGYKVPETWADFVTICKDLQSKNIAPMTIAGKDGWPVDMMTSAFVTAQEPDQLAFAKGLWTGERKWNDEKTLKEFQMMEEWASFFEKGVMGIDYASVIGRFVAGKAAMLPDGTWQGAQIAAADPNFKFGYFTIPGETKGSEPVQLAGKYDIQFNVVAQTANKDACLSWLDTLSQKDVYTAFVNKVGFIPSMPGVESNNEFMKSLEPLNKNFKLAYERVHRNVKGVGKYAGFKVAELKVLGGKVATAKELADLAQKDWETALKAIK